LQTCCFPLVFHKHWSQSSVPSIITVCLPYISIVYCEEVGSRSLCNDCIILPNYMVSHVRWLINLNRYGTVPWLGAGVSHYLLIVEVWVWPQASPCETLKFSVVFRCRSQYLAYNLATVKTWTWFGNRSRIISDLLFLFIRVFLFLIGRCLVYSDHTKLNHMA
jgi:hypothetical protein